MPEPSQAVELQFRDVSKRYPGAELPVIEHLSFDVPAGEICVLVGPSGGGKTTAMRMVNRMIDITDGDIQLGGESGQGKAPAEARRNICYAIQQPGRLPHPPIADNMAAARKLLVWKKQGIRDRVDDLLELVCLGPAETRDRYPAQLSGGMRQRVGVARALAADPPLMLMDEPFGAIDPINRERLQNEFLRLQADIRKTIVFVTHDIDEAIKMGDKVAVLKKGGVLAQYAEPAELLMAPADQFVEDFVGADRALKRLALQRVRDIDLWKAAIVQVGDPVSELRAKLEDADVNIPLLVDEQRRPIGWLSEGAARAERVRRDIRSPAEPLVELDDILRDALSRLLASETRYAPVVDRHGAVVGILSLEVISHLLHDQNLATNAPTGSYLITTP